jgi:ubiquinol-cytochrome c reductase core subunit 2
MSFQGKKAKKHEPPDIIVIILYLDDVQTLLLLYLMRGIFHLFVFSVPATKPEPARATSASVSTLPNGLTVVTEGANTTSTVTITYPKAGSASEQLDEQGAALVNKCLAFNSGSNLSTIRIFRSIENCGGSPLVSMDRTKATVGYTVPPEYAASLVPLLAVDCSFEKWDVRDAKGLAQTVTEEASASAQIVLTESLFAAAYGPQSPAGRSSYAYNVSNSAIKSFRQRAYGINGAVLAATGVKDHAAFCAQVAQLLEDAPVGSAGEKASMAYLGGETRVSAPSAGMAHVALAFKGPESSTVASVIKSLVDIVGLESGVSGFTAPGLVGAYAGGSGAELVDSITKVVTSSASADIIKRAKSVAKADALFAIDGGSQSLAAVMTSAVMESGSFSGPSDVAKAYDSVSDAQIKQALQAMLSGKPSLAAVGEIHSVPYHATVAARFS